jgi:hypothetical protein
VSDLFAVLVPGSVILIIIIYRFIVIKRHFVDKKSFKCGTEVSALGTFAEFVDKDKKVGIDHIQYLQEEKLEDDDGDKILTNILNLENKKLG